MEQIILTGYDEKQFNELVEKEEEGGCYLCKRIGKGIFLMMDGERRVMGKNELGFEFFSCIEDGREFLYPLCSECNRLLEKFIERILFKKEFGKQFSKG